jgi:Cft2 family RNA processing exonuclease
VVVEATYGVSNHLPREGREQRLLSRVRAILKGGGRCLLPVVALGRAQVPILARPFAGPVTELVESPQDRNACNTCMPPALCKHALWVYRNFPVT